METNWFIIDINPQGLIASRISAHEAAYLLNRGFQLALADGHDLNALARRQQLPLRVRELGGVTSFKQRAA